MHLLSNKTDSVLLYQVSQFNTSVILFDWVSNTCNQFSSA